MSASSMLIIGHKPSFINTIHMKKILTLLAFTAIFSLGANAQLGNLLSKTAQKVTERVVDKVTDKLSDKLANKASNAIFNRLGLDENGEFQPLTFPELFTKMPPLPTGQQLVDYQTALLNGRTLKMMTSPVMKYRTRAYSLLYRSESYSTQGMDSAALTNYILQSTGMTMEEVEAIEKMSEEEQQLFIMQKYQSKEAVEARRQYAQNATQYAKEAEAQVTKYHQIETEIEALYKEMEKQIKPIYDTYRDKMEGSSNAKITLEYYAKVVNIVRSTVEQAIQLRINKQIPLVEEIEKIQDATRSQHPEAVLVSYKQLFTSSFINDVEQLMNIPVIYE